MTEPRWISQEHCVALHEMMLLRYGGVGAVRDSAVLNTVLARPKAQFAAGTARLTSLAACYAAGIVLDRPFSGGNLASGFIIAATFLGSNGFTFHGDELSMVGTVLQLAQRQQSEAEFAHYLRCNCDPLER